MAWKGFAEEEGEDEEEEAFVGWKRTLAIGD